MSDPPTEGRSELAAQRDEERWLACIHEAGHAVIAYLLGMEVREAAVAPSANGKQKYDGYVRVGEANNPAVQICILLSGSVAEALNGVPFEDAL